ncbi:hypothetical protein F7725_004883 [Dissostichus mawsoni]|uniref:Uncharacterized protein n=1 Tax=Dissostichus mawsoni TaxID=36200 RepID=A0A7J5XLJ6_DISMA|nr:hypothetical protein F7725_004883 [Dissostichus mawsoni]
MWSLVALGNCCQSSLDWSRRKWAGLRERYGGADVGDRTMLDALCPAVDELMKLKTAPPGGQVAVLQSAVKVT